MSFIPGRYNFTIYQGATFDRTWTWTTDGTPVDLTGCTARMQVRKTASDPILFEATTENGFLTLGSPTPSDGTITLSMTADDTMDQTWTSGQYDLEIVFPSTEVTRLLMGRVKVSANITHP